MIAEADLPMRIKDAYDGCSLEEKGVLRRILEELSMYGESPTYNNIWLADYNEIPVSIDSFLVNDTYLGKVTRQGTSIYPSWRTAMREVFNAGNKFEEIVLTGATRIGKTSTGITMTAYMLYRLMCLKNPQEYFHKKDVSKFSIMFFNITKDLAKGVAFREFNDTLYESPWFQNKGKFSKSDENFYYIPYGGKVSIDYGSSASHGLGKQIFVGFMDEVAFASAGIKDVNKAKARMKELYDTVSTRVKGTFRQNGEVHGKVFAISSKKSDSDFMEYYLENQKQAGNLEHMYIFDKPQWEVLPESMFSKKKFCIAVGSKEQKGFVVSDDQDNPEGHEALKAQGFQLLFPPEDMKVDFKSDFDIALRDLAGISVPGTLSYIVKDIIAKCIGERRNPFYVDKISTGLKDRLTIEEFFHLEEIPKVLMNKPLYIHMDLSLDECNTGLSGVWVSGRRDIEDKDGNTISVLLFTHAFSIAIEAPGGDNIPYQKIVQFICWLRSSGMYIPDSGISRDQYQSEYVAQQLKTSGFGDVPKVSLDRTPDGYQCLRAVLSENRIDLVPYELLENELIHLQRDAFSGKIDKPIGGSKDVSDSLAGCVWNATLRNPNIPIDVKDKTSAMVAVNALSSRRNQPVLPAMGLGRGVYPPNRRR